MKQDDSYNITPEHATKILAKEGMVVTLEQAKLILDFLYKLANISLDTHMGRSK